MKHLLVIDSSGFCYRAYFAFPRSVDKKGRETHAVIGFMSMVYKMMGRVGDADPPTYAAAVFDAPGKTFRHKIFKEYKANRSRPEGLTYQLPMIREAAHVLGLEPLELKGYEADDVLATLAAMAKGAGMRTTIVSGDKDMGQLVEDEIIEIVEPMQKVRVLAVDVAKKFGVEPRLVPHVQALCGDAVDNIPGVDTIGPKTAARLIAKYGTIEALLTALKDTPHAFGQQQLFWLNKHRKLLPTYLDLATLRTDVPLTVVWEDLVPRTATRGHIRDMLRLLDAEDQLDRLFPEPGRPRIVFRRVDPMDKDEALAWWRKELKHPGQKVPDLPQVGFYRRRLVKGGEYVGGRIWREPDLDRETGIRSSQERLLCEVNGERSDASGQWGYFCSNPITEAAYAKLMKMPPKDAMKPIDWLRAPI
jgi:5'-3' exonuclease